MTLRAGVKRSDWDVALYVDNLLNSRTSLVRYHEVDDSPAFRDTTFRPLTVGLSAKYSF